MDDVQVDFTKKTADVTMKADKTLSRDACVEALKGSKYGVSTFAETPASEPGG